MVGPAEDSPRPAVVPGKMLTASLVSLLGAYVALWVPFLGVPIAASALAWLWFRGMKLPSVIIAVGCGAATFASDLAGPIYVTLWLLIAGPLAAAMLSKRSLTSVVLVVTLLMSGVWIGLITGAAAYEGKNVQGLIGSLVKTATEPALKQVVGTDKGAEETRKQIGEMATTITRMWPAVFVIMSFLTSLFAVSAVAAVAKTSGAMVNGPPTLPELDMSPHVVWVLIAGVGLVALDKFIGGWNGGILGIAGENALSVIRWVLFVQGVAVFSGLYRRAGFSRLSRSLGYVLLGITEILLPLVSLTGLVDLFVNVRKLPRDGVVGPTIAAESGSGSESSGDRGPWHD
ncbi:MAG: DUF2232 domain-containing protein [Actinomycetota bacterium]|nr:MAG: hypothetical protein FD171_197 [Actinomycetota bacterium]MDO8949485.1 DUF2232 domain-containing protein [Actinomycetota bacterium]MDP3629994.1 DUF2232 domain-containing protein [Actinomycetota bacterium]